jgi:hypothetical protein
VTSVSKVLDRVDGLKQTGASRWISRCPAHEDKSPSLSIRETDDGRVLLHDFGGCETGDVLAALGLDFADLFDKPLENHLPPIRGGFNARELLELLAHEAFVAVLIVGDAAERDLTDDEFSRLRLAAARLGDAVVRMNA